MRIAHISDLHILDLVGVSPRQFLNRRIAGATNLLLFRNGKHRPEILERLIEDLLLEDVDHIAITGDLSNLALDAEFDRVFHLIKLLGGYNRVSIVPGNHDYYTAGAIAHRRFEKYFHRFMFRSFSDTQTSFYPWEKQIDKVVFLGLNSATHTTPPLSYGLVSDRQLDDARKILTNRKNLNRRKVVLLHHCLHKQESSREWSTRLIGRDKLLDLLKETGVDLVLHGHDHRGRSWDLEGEKGNTKIICCGSSTIMDPDHARAARYRIITLGEQGLRRVATTLSRPHERRFLRRSRDVFQDARKALTTPHAYSPPIRPPTPQTY